MATRRGRRAVVLAALAAVACGRGPASRAPARHLVLVTIDTLRADRLGCYGGRDVATPNLDRLAREGAMAPQATVHVPLTRPSHVSLFTGLLPAEHAIRDNVSPALAAGIPTLAEALRGAGFRTAAFVSSIVLSSQSGLARGFDVYGDRFQADGDDARFLNTIQKRGDQATGEAIDWLRAAGEERRFLWLHLYDPHDPYEPPEPYASRYAGRPYDGEVAYADELVGRLDAALGERGLRDQALLVVTSDHGEGLGDHGESVHGFFVYQSTLAVPLLLRGPGVVAGGRLEVTARTIDLLPTVLDLLGLEPPVGMHPSGRSLAAALRGGDRPPELASYAESLLPLLHFGWSDLRVLREGRWKYIQAPRPELYDLQEDPAEARNLADEQPARAEALRAALGRQLAAERSAVATPGAAGVPPDLLEKLGALGYLGPGAPAQSSAPGADPKDMIEEFKVANRLVREGLVRLREKDHAGSAASFRELLSRGIESFEVHYYLARALAAQRQHPEAIRHFEAALRFQPAYAAAHRALAASRAAIGDRDGAIRALDAARPLAPRDALLRIRLGELLRDRGDRERAATLMREAIAIDGEPASYWNALGLVLAEAGRIADAEPAFREAYTRDPKDAEYAYNLGLALQRQGKTAEAAPLFRRALELEPRFAAARARLRELR
jgi:arylsulfatase A-like enzyme/Flp pilus assembly protein TadD